MVALTFNEIVTGCQGKRYPADLGEGVSPLVERICTDSRQTRDGDLFIALVGDRFDGHQYVASAAERGAVAAVVEASRLTALPSRIATLPLILVDHTRRALGNLAADYRRRFDLPIIAVGGSNGKTSTKDILVKILSRCRCVLGSQASFNNDVGVPLTLLELEPAHEAAVLEVGTNHPGELAPLVGMIQPEWGVITSLGREHLEHFGDLSGVVREEGWLAELLPKTGKLFINGDCPEAVQVRARCASEMVTVGFNAGNHWRLWDYQIDAEGLSIVVNAPRKDYSGTYRIPLWGRHQALNAVLAIAVSAEIGLSREDVASGLAECFPSSGRLQVRREQGLCLIDDTYNANPDSMLAALGTLQEMPGVIRRIAVLGDMAELGRHREAAHVQLGRFAATTGLDHLFALGTMAEFQADGAREAGLEAVSTHADVAAGARAVQQHVRAGDAVLVKASRVNRLERVCQLLKEQGPGGDHAAEGMISPGEPLSKGR